MVPYPPADKAGPEAARLLANPAALKGLLQSPETRRLMELLGQQGDLSAAARKAKAGDTQELQAMLSRLGSSPEGSQALNQMEQRLK